MRRISFLFSLILLSAFGLNQTCHAAKYILKEKAVEIDADWNIRAVYNSVVLIENQKDILTYSNIDIPQSNSWRKITGIKAFSVTEKGRKSKGLLKEEAILFQNLEKGSTINYRFCAETRFTGFNGIFSDRFRIDENTPVDAIHYSLKFPEKTNYKWTIQNNTYPTAITFESNDWFHFKPTTSSKKFQLLKILTNHTWGDVRNRFEMLYSKINRSINGKGIPVQKIYTPECRDLCKIKNLMRYLQENFEYRLSFSESHGFIPHEPADVLKRGWGDCKDIVFLATVLLDKVGIDTSVVLSGADQDDSSWADPFILDHAVLGFQKNGETYYFDFTKADLKADTNNKKLLSLGRL